MELVAKPEAFDTLVTPNLYGNLVSNIVSGLAGGTGLCPGANIGNGIALFEQGARDVQKGLAGKSVANPTAMLLSTAMMFRHLGLEIYASRLEAAIRGVYKEGDKAALTPDVGGSGSTMKFALAVIKQLERQQ
jgi:isocitrate dehydrogenase (NAD+)